VREAERTRTYTATLTSRGEDRYVVTLADAVFLTGSICTGYASGLGCHQFPASVSDGAVRFVLENNNDDAHGGHIVEQATSGWLEIIGEATGPAGGSAIEASGIADVWYCPESRAYPFPCRTFRGCQSAALRMTLDRN
jgi:hypothetical protein